MYIIHSNVTGKDYDIHNTVRITIPLQIAKYLKHGAEILDLYDSIDQYTGQPCIVAIFDRDATAELFIKWKNREL